MFEQICEIIKEFLEDSSTEIRLESALKEDLGLDSLAIVSILASVEDKYNVTIAERDLLGFNTIADVVDWLSINTK